MSTEVENKHVAKRILIVEDDYYFRIAIEKSLQHMKHVPVCAENVAHAKQLLGLEQFDLVISDIRMPDETGIQLLQWIKANNPLPVVLMTGFSNIAETHEAAQVGADGFLAKPFKKEELERIIKDSLPNNEKENTEPVLLDSEYCKISMDDFISGREMQYDIYMRVTSIKYVKLAHKGENLDQERIRAYKKKGIMFLYMQKEDFKKYLDLNLVLLGAVVSNKKFDNTKKLYLIKHTSEVMLQNLHKDEIDEEMYHQAGALVENAVSILAGSSETADLLAALAGHTDHLYVHSVGVSMYAALIGKALGWNSPTTIFKLALGGLLHDIGKKELPAGLLNKSRNELTPQDVTEYETHSTRGAEILAAVHGIPTDILQIANEHHENCLGLGYPARLKRMKIHPLARVVAVANEFCSLVLKNPNSQGMKPADAIQRMLSLHPDYYEETSLQALIKVFKLDLVVSSRRKSGTSE